MKTTIELPDGLFREAKATAARRGTSLKNLVREAIEEKLGRESDVYAVNETGPRWPAPSPLSPEEARRFEEIIEQEFEQIDPEDWV